MLFSTSFRLFPVYLFSFFLLLALISIDKENDDKNNGKSIRKTAVLLLFFFCLFFFSFHTLTFQFLTGFGCTTSALPPTLHLHPPAPPSAPVSLR